MGDRTTQIAREWMFKCANVVAECRDFPDVRSHGASTSGRIGIRRTDAADDAGACVQPSRGRGASKSNRWFNLVTPRSVDVETALESGDDGRVSGEFGDAWTHRERLVVLDVRFGRDDEEDEDEEDDATPTSSEKKMIDDALLERWVFHLGADGDKVGGNNHFNKDLDASVVYKRGVIMVRTLAALLRTLPAHGARLRALQRRVAHPSRSSVGGRFSFSVRDLDIADSASIENAHPGKSAGYRTYAFADVATSVGKLRACVYFLDSLAVKDIEDRFIAASIRRTNVAPVPPPVQDVELAGGEMSLSPSPTKVDASTMTRAAEREAALRSLSRGLRFDDDDDVDERKTTTMTTSHSSDSLKPPPGGGVGSRTVVPPMASYTSPNNQRYDAAPNSAPTSGPAPIYGFNAAPVKTPPSSGGGTTSRNVIDAETTLPRLPGRRPMASCLKIDVGTSMEQQHTATQTQTQMQTQQQRITVAVVPPKQPSPPEPSTSPATPRASPIACSPGLPHARHSSANASRYVVGAASPSWGGLGCPESPIPSLGTSPSLPSRLSSGGGSRRSSWSPSSSLGTSLRDVVGVYPHSPGAFGRRVSGGGTLPEDGGKPPVGPNDDADASDDVSEFAPFALDDEDSAGGAMFIEHTPADLLSLLEAPSRLRRKDTDGPLPLDAALEDSTDSIVNQVESAGTGTGIVKAETEDKTTTSQRRAERDADSTERVTLASALVELENLRLIRDRMSSLDA